MSNIVLEVKLPDEITQDYDNLDQLIQAVANNKGIQDRYYAKSPKEPLKERFENFLLEYIYNGLQGKANFYTAKIEAKRID